MTLSRASLLCLPKFVGGGNTSALLCLALAACGTTSEPEISSAVNADFEHDGGANTADAAPVHKRDAGPAASTPDADTKVNTPDGGAPQVSRDPEPVDPAKAPTSDASAGGAPQVDAGSLAPAPTADASTASAGDAGVSPCAPDEVSDADIEPDTCLRVCAAATEVSLATAADVLAFASRDCEILDGTLRISGDEISDLSGLAALRKITGVLRLDGTSQLADLRGLENLVETGLVALNTVGLETLTGLDSVQRIRNTLQLSGNVDLLDVKALSGAEINVDSVTVVGHSALLTLEGLELMSKVSALVIADNSTLRSVSALENLSQLSSLTLTTNAQLVDARLPALVTAESATVAANAALAEFSVPSLTSAGYLLVASNPQLVTADLSGLQTVDTLYITDNAALTTLGQLDALETIGELTATANTALSQCIVDELAAHALTCVYCVGNGACE